MADRLANGLFISEILADNAGGSAVDVDGDGTTNKADEYVEIQNGSGQAVSLDGVQIWSQKEGLLYSFGASDTIAPGGTATVLGEYSGTPPAGFYSAGINPNGNFLPDGENSKFDAIFLYDGNTDTYVVLAYGDPPRDPELPTGFPSGATRIGAGEEIGSSAPNGVAFIRDSDGDFVEGGPDPGNPGVLCLAKGTRVRTGEGLVPIEALRPGAWLPDETGALHPLRAIGRLQLDTATRPEEAPVILPAALTGGTRPLRLSPNHRIAHCSPMAELLLGHHQVLLPAKSYAQTGHARIGNGTGGITYYHLLFDAHILLDAEGAWVESLFLGDMARDWRASSRARGDMNELSALRTDAIRHDRTAAMIARDYEARIILGSDLAKAQSGALAA